MEAIAKLEAMGRNEDPKMARRQPWASSGEQLGPYYGKLFPCRSYQMILLGRSRVRIHDQKPTPI